MRRAFVLFLLLGLVATSSAVAAARNTTFEEDVATMLDDHKPFNERDAAIRNLSRAISDKRPFGRQHLITAVLKTFEGNNDIIANNASWLLVSIGTEAVPALLADLDRPGKVGLFAATALGYYEGQAQLEIYPRVIEKLRSSQAVARMNAARALSRTGWVFSVHHDEGPAVSVASALTDALKDPDPRVKHMALGALSMGLGSYASGSIEPLVEEFGEPDIEIRILAAEALGRIGAPATRRIKELLSRSTGTNRMLAAAALAFSDPNQSDAVPVLLLAQRSENPSVRSLAIGALAELGPHALSAQSELVNKLNDSDPVVRCQAVYALQRLGTPPASVVPRLIELVKNDNQCDQNAIVLLGLIGPPARRAIPELTRKIHGEVGSVPCNAAEALVRIGTASIPALLRVAQEPDEYRRAWSSWALAQLASDQRVPLKVIDNALCDPSREVSSRTKEGLGRAGIKTGRLSRFFDSRQQEFRSTACRGSYRAPVAAIPRGNAQPVREELLDRRIIPELLKELDGPKRQEALRTLNELGPYAAAAVPKLLAELPAAASDDRRMIAGMLGSIGANPEACVPVLVELMRDSDTWTSDIAFLSLSLFGDAAEPAVPAMIAKLKSGKLSDFMEDSFASISGPAATAALPYYRNQAAEEDEVKAAHGARMMLRIAPNEASTRKVVLSEAKRGPSRRRCLIAGELRWALGDDPVIKDLPILADESCRKILERLPQFSGMANLVPPKPAPSSLPRLKIKLALARRTYFVGEAIEVTPEIPGWPQPAGRYSQPSFFRDPGSIAFDLLPEIRTSSGVLVEAGGASDTRWGGVGERKKGALPSQTMANMMMNGFVTPRPGSIYAVGRPATIFIREPGRYKLAIPESMLHVRSSTGPLNAVSADPVDIRIVPPTDEFVARTLREIGNALTSTDAMERGWAAERLRNLGDERAIPLLLHCLEDEYKNVLTPSLMGLLEYPHPQAVAREIRKAIGEGRPTRPELIQWYADILARTEHGWPGTDWRSQVRVEGDSAKWKLLLEYREKERFRNVKLSPSEAVEGIKDGFISEETSGACDAAWKGLLDEGTPAALGVVEQIVSKCGNKASSKNLWRIVRSERFDSSARTSACYKLYDLGDKAAYDFILTDMASAKPVLYHTIASLPIMKSAPKAVGDIVLAKLASNDSLQARFASDLFWSLDVTPEQKFDLLIDPAKLRETLLTCGERVCDSVVWAHVARYLATRSPKDALRLIEAKLPHCRTDQFADCGGPIHILAMLPHGVGGPLVRKLLNSRDPKESLEMLRGVSSDSQGPGYFRELLALFKSSSDDPTRAYAALGLQRISNLPSAQFAFGSLAAGIDHENASRWIKEWERWQNQHHAD